MKTTDNNIKTVTSDEFKEEFLRDIEFIANRSIGELVKENPNLLVFPPEIGANDDEIENNCICNFNKDKLSTYNVMGFIGVNNSQLTISSRFYQKENDYFLHYMLQQVFSLNLFDLKHGKDDENIWDFLIYLFPYYLKRALNQGLYKEYINNKYNNPNVKGKIDIQRHIRFNRPFSGNIAFTVREHSYDNPVTQLIRHTIEYLKSHHLGSYILKTNTDTQSAVNQIKHATGNYNKNERESVIFENLKHFRHPYFSEYRELQKICMMILRQNKLTFGKEKNKVYGVLFDGAWLWEEYLNTLLIKQHYIHPKNNIGQNPIYLFQDSKYKRYPDFYKNNIVLDAKYKRLDITNLIDRNDIHQMISYIYVQSAKFGSFIYPEAKNNTTEEKIGTLNGYGGIISKISIKIPKGHDKYSFFIEEMKSNESNFMEIIRKFESTD